MINVLKVLWGRCYWKHFRIKEHRKKLNWKWDLKKFLGDLVYLYVKTRTFWLQSWTKDCRQIHEISKICFSMKCFTADFSRYFSKNVTICLLDGRLGTHHQIQAFQWFSWNFLISLDPVLSRSATREATRTFTFWLK